MKTRSAPLRFASCMASSADAVCREIADYLGQQLGLSIEVVDDVPWPEREKLLDAGEIDLCWICGLPYVEKADEGRAIELCVAPVMQGARYGNLPIYFSDVVVRSGSAYTSFADLRGATWAYNEPRSHSGYNLVCGYLAEQGETLRYFSRIVEAGAHQAALRMVLSGSVAAAAIDSTVLEAEVKRFPGLAGTFSVIHTLGPSPAAPWILSKRLPAELRQKLRRCLTGMARNAEGAAILADWGIAELRAVEDSAYDPIRTTARTAAGAAVRQTVPRAGARMDRAASL